MAQPIKATGSCVGCQIILWLMALANVVIVARAQMMPAMFILGDSLTDNGNNNYILTLAKSNFPPNGLDFQYGPTEGSAMAARSQTYSVINSLQKKTLPCCKNLNVDGS
jgi:hypothetical protein